MWFKENLQNLKNILGNKLTIEAINDYCSNNTRKCYDSVISKNLICGRILELYGYTVPNNFKDKTCLIYKDIVEFQNGQEYIKPTYNVLYSCIVSGGSDLYRFLTSPYQQGHIRDTINDILISLQRQQNVILPLNLNSELTLNNIIS